MLCVDVSTAYAENGRIAHGTLRVERGLVAALAVRPDREIVFCRYHRLLGRFVKLSAAEAMQIVTAAEAPERRREAVEGVLHSRLSFGRKLEQMVREKIRNPLRSKWSVLAGLLASPDQIFVPGAVMLIPGELQRHNFSLLMRLRRQFRVRLAFVYYDLLNALPRYDPRLTDPSAVDLPGSDFMAREADLLLAISRYSADALRQSLTARNLNCPRIEVIRLAGVLDVRKLEPVAGLNPGDFVITVGDVVARKNHSLLVSVWERLLQRNKRVLRLVIAGRAHRESALFLDRLRNNEALASNISLMQNVSSEQLAWLYANCRFSLFPSFAEGFGLPVAESLSTGKICIASSTTSMPEASQGCAIHLDPRDETAWQIAIERLIDSDDELRNRERELQASFQVTKWEDTAAEVLSFIEN